VTVIYKEQKAITSMPELRKDPVTGRWVIISTERAKRPSDFQFSVEEKGKVPCPFCGGHENETPPEVFAMRVKGEPDTPGWDVRVIPNMYPALRVEGDLGREGVGMCDMMNGVGAHEVIVETPEHAKELSDLDVGGIKKVLVAYKERIEDLEKDTRLKYVLIFKNKGKDAGASLQHSHSQLIATPITPKRVKEELQGAKEYYEYKRRCVFCDYMKQETKLFRDRLIRENEDFVALAPFASCFPFEVWILPKRHSPDFVSMSDREMEGFAVMLKEILNKIRRVLNDPPFNYVLHMAPFRRPKAGYWGTIDEDYHWHLEITPRITKLAGFELGSDFYINPTSPEVAAELLKGA
jgi:UDPglucose--hexose-1-phosphate uridylyltransferase